VTPFTAGAGAWESFPSTGIALARDLSMNMPVNALHRELSELLQERHQALLRHDADAFFSTSRRLMQVRQELQSSLGVPRENLTERDPALG
jgi:hypothetical protein